MEFIYIRSHMRYNNAETLQKMILEVSNQLSIYLRESQNGDGKVLDQKAAQPLANQLNINELVKSGGLHLEKGISQFLDGYLTHSQHMHHPQYIGHQVAVPHIGSGIADLIHGVINNPMAIYEMGPSGAVIEKAMVNWLLQQIGWFQSELISDFTHHPENGGGVFTHGGSMANLTALLAARAHIAPASWSDGSPDDLVVIGSEVWHYSISRAMSIMGMPQQSFYPAAVDENDVMTVEGVHDAVERAKRDGKRVMVIIANACTTSTGLYDPIDEIGMLCEKEGIWFHVDGAHGASVLLSEKHRHLMKGVERADSVIWDMHKMLRTSTLCAAVLYKNPTHMAQTFQQDGSYIFHEKESVGFDLISYSLECTKAALASKLFWVLAIEGEQGVADYVTHQYDLTKDFYDLINGHPDYVCPYIPESNILCFRYSNLSDDIDSGDFQLKLRNELVNEGNFYITSCDFKGSTHLRITVMNDLTTEDHIITMINEICLIAERMLLNI